MGPPSSKIQKPPVEGTSLSRLSPSFEVKSKSNPNGFSHARKLGDGWGFILTVWGKPSRELSLFSQSGFHSRSAPGRLCPPSTSLPRALPPPRLWLLPLEAQGCSSHYLGQVFLEGLQGEDHGGGYSPVVMPGETGGVLGQWRVGKPSGCQRPCPRTHFSLIFTTRFGSSRRPGFWARSR